MAQRDKATQLIKTTFPDAKVVAEANGTSQVSISCNDTKIVTVAQRDLYRKYNWPAAPKVTQMLEM